MRTSRSSAVSGLRAFLFLLLLVVGVSTSRAYIVDLNADAASDIWALKYGVTSFVATADSDGDGMTDGEEATAGTDPYSANSAIEISSLVLDGTGLHLTFPSLLGKQYLVQRSVLLSPATWAMTGALTAGVAGDLTITLPAAGATGYFYRVVVQDMDSDGDHVNDWEEITLGFDPKSSHSNGLGQSDDLAKITAALQATNVVSIAAVTPSALETGLVPGVFLVTRSGNLNPITVPYTVSGSAVAGSDYVALSGSVVLPLGVNSASIIVTPLADAAVEGVETVLATLTASAAYTFGTPKMAAVLIFDTALANGNGVLARYWNSSLANINTYATAFPATAPALTRVETQINNAWLDSATQGVGSPGTGVNTDYFVSRYTADVLPEFSQVYTFELDANTAARLTVNGQVIYDNWGGSTVINVGGTIELQGGKRYPIVFEHMERTGDANAKLRWSSANRPKELIPQNRLFASAPPQILSATEAVLLKNSGLFNYQIVASGEPTGYSAANLPPGWSVTSGGLISGLPSQGGVWEIPVTATNASGSGSAILTLTIVDTSGAITRDVWNGTYATVSALPLSANPASTSLVTTLEGPQNPGGANYGSRLRGFLFAPKTGVYKFWIAASDNAELWISNDSDPINLFLRAATTGGTGYRDWVNVNAGKSALLYLEAGQKYSVEVRHADIGADGNVSVGWLKPGEGGNDPANSAAPSEVVPGYALSPFVAPTVVGGESTLFTTIMSAQGAATTSGYGSAALRLSADETQAILSFNYANLTTPVTGKHIHSGVDASIIFDIDTAVPNSDGSYTWTIVNVGPFTAAQVRSQIKQGNTYLNIHTSMFLSGEIKGFFTLQAASQNFTEPAAPPILTDDHTDRNAAARFLIQATFGPTPNDLSLSNPNSVLNIGYDAWINNEFNKPATHHYPYVYTNRSQTNPGNPTYPSYLIFRSWWLNSTTAPDQLRQRVAFALSEIMVVSEAGPLTDNAQAVSDYYDMLLENAFGDAKNLLKAVTLHPAMGRYLDMYRNDKPDLATGRIPNENYAREIKQLFSIGLNRLWPDGSLMVSAKGDLIPTYDQNAIIGFAHVFTGWDYGYPGAFRTSFGAGSNWIAPMREVPVRHYTGQKRLLNNVVLPGLAVVGGQPLNPYATHTAAQYGDPAYQALPAQELDAAHAALVNHPNFGPFICRQLIQRLVTSTPSRGYLFRVVSKFNDNGSGVRGDMKAVIKTILLDYEARSTAMLGQQGYGKQREPVLRVTATARAFLAPPGVTGTYAQTDNLITVTTSAPHLYSTGQNAFLDFGAGSLGDPEDAAYAITVIDPTHFTARPLTSEAATYSQGVADGLITVTITGGHTYQVGESAYIDFTSGAPSSPADGVYLVTSRTSDDLQFTVRALSAKNGAYSQTGSVVTFTSPVAHGLAAGNSVHLDFTSGTPDLLADGVFLIDTVSVDGLQFTFTAPDAVTRTGSATATPAADVVARTGNATTTKPSSLRTATYSQTASAINLTVTSSHSFSVGQSVQVTFTSGVPSAPTSGIYTVASVSGDRYALTVTAADSVARTGSASVANAVYVANRTGTVLVNYGDWEVDTTNTDLNQTPMQSPTVFNFYLPDYQFPGILALAGMITPEFQLTSETSVMRQANFLYNGLFNDTFGTSAGTYGLCSFKSNNRDIVMDLRPWMQIGPGGLPWAHNSNVGALIDELNTRLCAGQLPSTPTLIAPIPARTIISNFVQTLPYGKTITAISQASPCVITANGHGLTNGQTVTIAGVIGGNFSAPINGTFTVANATTNTFTVGINRLSGGTALGSLSGATASPAAGYPDQLRERVRSIVHLIVTSPDFTIQK